MTGSQRMASPTGGFALVEALASLVIVAMIAFMLIAGLTTGRRVWDRIDTREARGDELESAQATLRDRIEQAFPLTMPQTNPPNVAFRGGAQTLDFLANPPEAARPAPLQRYRLSLDIGGNVVLSSVGDVAPKPGGADRQVLARGVRRLDISYFGVVAPNAPARWSPTWANQTVLPDIVRVRIAFDPNDPRWWPDLLVHPRATVDSLCLLNLSTHHCKGRL